jgi:hypothetical protein
VCRVTDVPSIVDEHIDTSLPLLGEDLLSLLGCDVECWLIDDVGGEDVYICDLVGGETSIGCCFVTDKAKDCVRGVGGEVLDESVLRMVLIDRLC